MTKISVVFWLSMIIHGCVCALYLIMIKRKKINPGLILAPVVILIPVFGILSVYIMNSMIALQKDGTLDIKEHQQDTSYSRISVESESPELAIPLEEAIFINDASTRRTIMLDILRKDPLQFIDLLQIARFGNDVEVTHYATTTIMEIQRNYDLSILEVQNRLRKTPEDLDVLNSYIFVLMEYIECGLLHGYLLKQQRKHLAQLLQLKLDHNPSGRKTQLVTIQNDLRLGNFEHAQAIVSEMIERWPNDERVWLAAMNIVMEEKDAAKKHKLMRQIQSAPVHWTVNGRNFFRFICGEDFVKTLSLDENEDRQLSEEELR